MAKRITYKEALAELDKVNRQLHLNERMVAYLAGGAKPQAYQAFGETDSAGRHRW